MFDPKTVSLGIAPIGWCNDDMPELGAENTFQQTVSEMALAGFTGCEIGNKYPTDPAELKKALDLRGMRIASRWYSSFILTRSMEEEEKDFIANLDFLEAVGANHINVSEQSYSIQGKVDGQYLRWYAIKIFERDDKVLQGSEPSGPDRFRAWLQAVLPSSHGHRGPDQRGDRPHDVQHRSPVCVPLL